MTAALDLQHLEKRFGGIVATCDVSLTLAPGARHAVIGPNGAGKTTLVNLITGALRPDGGSVILEGHDVSGVAPHRRTRLGLVRSFQVTSLFPSFSVFENVALAINERTGRSRALTPARGFANDVADEAEHVAGQLGLSSVGARAVRELSYGQQRLVEFAIAMALRPRVLLLDEPAAGLAHAEHATLLDSLDRLPPHVAVLLIEHDMSLVFRFAQAITVLANGAVLANGTPEAIRADPQVRAAYLGTRHG